MDRTEWDIASIGTLAAATAAGYYWWSPYLGYTEFSARVIATTIPVAVATNFGLLEIFADQRVSQTKIAKNLLLPSAMVLGAQAAVAYLARGQNQWWSAVASSAAASGVIALSPDFLLLSRLNYI